MSKEFDKYKSNHDFKKYESLNSYLDDDKTIDSTNDKFDKVITLKVTKETFEMWEQLCENWSEVLGYENKSKIFDKIILICYHFINIINLTSNIYIQSWALNNKIQV